MKNIERKKYLGAYLEEVCQGQQGQLNMIVNCIVGSNGLHS